MTDTLTGIRRVAVIGAGVSGISAAVHLRRAGLDVTVYERSPKAGGVWVYDERSSIDAAYPSILPSIGDSPEFLTAAARREQRHDSPLNDIQLEPRKGRTYDEDYDMSLSFAPPGPCYVALKNNVSTIEMELSCQKWKRGTEEFVPHNALAEYLQDTVRDTGALESVSFNTRVNNVEKVGQKWRLDISRLVREDSRIEVSDSAEEFDAVVVANGNYHAVNIPDIPGLSQWKRAFPERIRHSKLYRTPDEFKGLNVLLIGAGVSSADIARDIGTVANVVLQSSRGGPYDLPPIMLPENGARIGGVASFDRFHSPELDPDGTIPGTITLATGEKICHVHQIIICTGYHVSLPFLRQYHADGLAPEEASEEVLITNGQHTHNLHKDIWYIPDPSLAFIGVPYHVATWSLFEYQAMAVARVFSGSSSLPSKQEMREEYSRRLKEKGAGRTFHSLRATGAEIEYVRGLADMVNIRSLTGETWMPVHSDAWIEAYGRREARKKAVFGQVRDPKVNDDALMTLPGC